jgi:type VI secretion system secreted protein VgrG
MPPYEMPKSQTRSGIKTHSTPQDKDSNEHFNEIRFEDKTGAEELFVQAERTMNVLVKGDENRAVGGNRNVSTGQTWHTYTKGRREEITEDDHLVNVHGKNGMGIIVDKNFVLNTKEGFCHISTKQEVKISTEDTVQIYAKDAIALSAQNRIVLTCGNASILMTSDGRIAIHGTSVDINPASPPPAAPASASADPAAGNLIKTLGSIFADQVRAGLAAAKANGQLPAGASAPPSVASVP